MFSGIVSAVGTVLAAEEGRLSVSQGFAERPALGASVSVNGACLTVTGFSGGGLDFDLAPETRRRTNLGRLTAGDGVNLELPLRLDTRLDGHLVLGHVDAVVRVLEVRPGDVGRELRLELPVELARLVSEKGSVAVDGVSLTVARLGAKGADFEVALIPHTLDSTIAGGYRVGSRVNLEVDVVARYLERLLPTREA